MLGELTARQTSAAYHVGEIYGRFEWLHGRRRSAASPSYEIGRGRALNGRDHSEDAAIEADFTGLLREIPEPPRELAAIIEGLCTEDQAVPPGWMDLTRGALEQGQVTLPTDVASAVARRISRKTTHTADRQSMGEQPDTPAADIPPASSISRG